jgi:APA family basic amino acid/polyamine antiporter
MTNDTVLKTFLNSGNSNMDLLRKKAKGTTQDVESDLAKCLTATDLVFLGIGAIIGAGIFVLTGITAATAAGPAIIFCYIIAGLTCGFAALSYAELAASVGGCGSAYGYTYVGFGEIFAWIVGWDLLLEYALSVSAVSVGWSGYVADFLKTIQLPLPDYLVQGYFQGGIANVPAVFIILTLTTLLCLGVKSSARFNMLMVIVKLLVIALFIIIALQEVNVAYWTPFMPFGWDGVMRGTSLIFFAYVGFDAVSTAADEAINPQRDLPKGIILSLIICTVLYIVVSGLLTGIMPYASLNVPSPISHVLLTLGYKISAGLVGVGAIAGLTTVMLVMYYGLSRVFLAMARDGLLPHFFSKTHKTRKTPVRIVLLCGSVISVFSAFFPIETLAHLVNVGTLFAFVVVCMGVLVMRYKHPEIERPFKTPGMPYVPVLGIMGCLYLIAQLPWETLVRFAVWMVLGMVVYFLFSRKSSALNLQSQTSIKNV